MLTIRVNLIAVIHRALRESTLLENSPYIMRDGSQQLSDFGGEPDRDSYINLPNSDGMATEEGKGTLRIHVFGLRDGVSHGEGLASSDMALLRPAYEKIIADGVDGEDERAMGFWTSCFKKGLVDEVILTGENKPILARPS